MLAYFPDDGGQEAGPWHLDAWSKSDGPAMVLAGAELMSQFGTLSAKEADDIYMPMELRAFSKVRAGSSDTPSNLRRGASADDIETLDTRRPYTNYFAVAEDDLKFRRFDGSFSRSVTRASFLGADAVTVLPYDPVRDRVLLVEQFRFGPHARGDNNPWVLEPPAGRIDPGETPQEAAHRELKEEANLSIKRLIEIGSYYPSPGAWSEYLYSYVALCDLPSMEPGLGGLSSEDEDIQTHVLSFDAAFGLIASGEADTAPIILSLMWLAKERSSLRTSA